MNTLNFNDADLKANREGRLSDAQIKRLDAEGDRFQKQRQDAVRLCIGLFAVAAVAIGAFINARNGEPEALPCVGIIYFAVALVIFMGSIILIVSTYDGDIKALVNAPIHREEGTVEVLGKRADRSGQYFYRVILHSNWYSWMPFDFNDPDVMQMFKSGERYRVYYLSIHGNQMLSAEEIEPEKPKR